MIKLLIIEDEAAIRNLIRSSLNDTEFSIAEADCAKMAEKILSASIPDLIVLDWMLPGKNGIDFIKWLREHPQYNGIPVIMLTAKAEEKNKIMGLMQGADDYMTKPFSPAELAVRIKTVLRRDLVYKKTNSFCVGSISVDDQRKQIKVYDDIIKLRPIEYKILYFFITHPQRVFSRDELINFIWGHNTYIDERTVDVNIRRVRDKLKPYQLHTILKTLRGSGYICELDNV